MPTSAQRIAPFFRKFLAYLLMSNGAVWASPPTQKSEAGRFLEAALEQLIEFLGAVALVERDFPQRAGSGSGERCVCCFKGFRRTTVCSAPARRAKFSRWRQTLICCPRARILTRCLRKHLTRDSRERTQTARSYTASVKKMTSASQS